MAGVRRGLLFTSAGLQHIDGLTGSDYTTVFGINDVGGAVGGSNTATAVRAFLTTQAGGARELPPLPGDTASTAYAVNNRGQAAGFSSGPGGEHAVLWAADGSVTALPGASGRLVARSRSTSGATSSAWRTPAPVCARFCGREGAPLRTWARSRVTPRARRLA